MTNIQKYIDTKRSFPIDFERLKIECAGVLALISALFNLYSIYGIEHCNDDLSLGTKGTFIVSSRAMALA